MEVCRLKNIFITGCGSGLGKTLFEIGNDLNLNVYPHFRVYDKNAAIFGDINDLNFLNSLPIFLEKNKINVFINNAAIYNNQFFLDITDEEIRNIINTNLTSQILITKRIYEHFKKQKFGLIININSLSGKYPSAKETIYSASKHGMYSFSKSLQLESIGSKIEIVDVFMGAMKTRMVEDRNNYNTFIDPKEVAKLIYDLIQRETIFVNEIVIRKKS
jgi:short-subunit dehydrogenase